MGLIDLGQQVFGVDDRDDGIELGFAADVIVYEKGLGNWGRIRQTGSSDQDAVELAFPGA